ncbi:denticleless protein homolog [Jatropha curcas]|uniref:denticleless protein homolog n=1 Tax=Jatropha curcas TaxID=180498 RepID=UPI001895E46C|nr:denticleless protein homolog [Jatropha curcas]XP_037495374.1 denticleless protein homolog [Jatropha curcas]
MDSVFQGIRSRELNGFRVRKRPYIGNKASDFAEFEALAVEHSGEDTPPLAISFGKTSKTSHILAVSDEDGFVSLFDARKKFPAYASHQEFSDKARISEWVAHQNAIFDICWIKEDTNILTASGDQTIKIWDAQEKKCTGVLTGHIGSIKSMCPHPTNSDILVSGSRDGSFAIWDLRCKIASGSRYNEACITSTAMVQKAHLSPQAKRVRRGKAASMSITSVLYLKDEISIATAGAVDSVVKFWDTRNLKAQVTQACPHSKSSPEKEKRFHGISSLSQDLNGVFLTASCMDHRIYLYNVLQLGKGPIQSFSGCRIESFYVKSAISPDAAHILSGSSDGKTYIWQVNKPCTDPITLKSNDGEVTAVDWSPSDGKIATASDDFTVRIWNMQNSYCSTSRSPSSIRRRIMAIPSEECRRLLMNEEPTSLKKDSGDLDSSNEACNQIDSPNSYKMHVVRTPESQKRKFSSDSDSKEAFNKTPEAAVQSPSSVLNPPSSLKRKTIRDYFLAA